ncbi:hypothetical protein RYX36_010694, partial [Vicia faba]
FTKTLHLHLPLLNYHGESIDEIETLAKNNVTETIDKDSLGSRRVLKFDYMDDEIDGKLIEKTTEEFGDTKNDESDVSFDNNDGFVVDVNAEPHCPSEEMTNNIKKVKLEETPAATCHAVTKNNLSEPDNGGSNDALYQLSGEKIPSPMVVVSEPANAFRAPVNDTQSLLGFDALSLYQARKHLLVQIKDQSFTYASFIN